MALRLEEANESNYNPLEINPEAPFTQSFFYGEIHRENGRKVLRFNIYDDETLVSTIQVIQFKLILTKKYLYSPYGPVIKAGYEDAVIDFIKKEFKKITKKNRGVFMRLDFFPFQDQKMLSNHVDHILYKTNRNTAHGSVFQPRNEWILDITKTEDELLKDLHKNTRYSIKFSEKNGVTTKIFKDNLMEHFDIFYDLMLQTSDKKSFGLHDKDYYRKVFEQVEKNNAGFLAVSYLDNTAISIALNIIYGDVCMYAYAASNPEHKKLMCSYKIVWESILYSKSIGIKKFNFGGINEDPKSKLSKLTVFKQKFKGYKLIHNGFYDIVSDSFWYMLFLIWKTFR